MDYHIVKYFNNETLYNMAVTCNHTYNITKNRCEELTYKFCANGYVTPALAYDTLVGAAIAPPAVPVTKAYADELAPLGNISPLNFEMLPYKVNWLELVK